MIGPRLPPLVCCRGLENPASTLAPIWNSLVVKYLLQRQARAEQADCVLVFCEVLGARCARDPSSRALAAGERRLFCRLLFRYATLGGFARLGALNFVVLTRTGFDLVYLPFSSVPRSMALTTNELFSSLYGCRRRVLLRWRAVRVVTLGVKGRRRWFQIFSWSAHLVDAG